MRVVIAYGTIDLAEVLYLFQLTQLSPQTCHHIGKLFSHSRGTGRLTVSTCKHRYRCCTVGDGAEGGSDFQHIRQQHLRDTVAQHQSMRQIINIFRRTAEVHELGN